MNRTEALRILKEWDQKKVFVFRKCDLASIFSLDSAKTLSMGIARLVKSGILKRACRGVYVNLYAQSLRYTDLLERIVLALRPGCYNYISLEYMLSEYGGISQIPIDRITIMTTGRKGEHKTAFGIIEFTHTNRSIQDILKNTRDIDGPLRIATRETAWRDLKRVGRNTHMVNLEELFNES